jgi:hypothetical protein
MEVGKYYRFQHGKFANGIIRPLKVVDDVALVQSMAYDNNLFFSQTKEIRKDQWWMFQEITSNEYMNTLQEMLDNTFQNEFKIVMKEDE